MWGGTDPTGESTLGWRGVPTEVEEMRKEAATSPADAGPAPTPLPPGPAEADATPKGRGVGLGERLARIIAVASEVGST